MVGDKSADGVWQVDVSWVPGPGTEKGDQANGAGSQGRESPFSGT